MISNLEFLIQNFGAIVNYPFLISIAPLIFGGLLYLFGKIRVSNQWQYHLDNKYVPFLHGIVVINNYVFIPIILLLFFYYLVFDIKELVSWGFLSIFVFVLLLNLLQKTSKQLIAWNKTNVSVNTETGLFHKMNIISELLSDWKNYLKLFLVKAVFPALLYLSIYYVLLLTQNRAVYALIAFVWLLSMIYFSNLDTKLEQHKTFDLQLQNKKLLNDVKIIEFLNDGSLLKYQDNKGIVKVVPTSNISEIVLNKRSKTEENRQ